MFVFWINHKVLTWFLLWRVGTSCIRQILEKKWEYNEAVHQLFIDFKKAYDSVRREVLYNILIEFGVPKKLVRLIKMCLTETYSRVYADKTKYIIMSSDQNSGWSYSMKIYNNTIESVEEFKYLGTTLTQVAFWVDQE